MDNAVAQMLSMTRRYTRADVQAFLPYLLVTFAPAFDVAALPVAAIDALGALVERLGVTHPADAPAALKAHFAINPPNAKLVADFERFFREQLRSSLAVASTSPTSSDAHTKVLSSVGAPRPAGTIAAGPFARFQTQGS